MRSKCVQNRRKRNIGAQLPNHVTLGQTTVKRKACALKRLKNVAANSTLLDLPISVQ